MINVAVVGATGYAGEELIKVLLRHPGVKITSVSAKIDKPQKISEIFPAFKGSLDLVCAGPDIKEILEKSEVVFLALPHRVSMEYAPEFLKAGKKVIDLSADYRLKDTNVYEKYYGVKHKNAALIKEAVYGLPELYREKIKQARFIANPGCYPTGAILGIAPALFPEGGKNLIEDDILIDAKSGVSGAGRPASAGASAGQQALASLSFCEVNENLKAYKINEHQHMPEINQELSNIAGKEISVTFVPHLIPINRGILSTIYLKLKKNLTTEVLLEFYKNFYKREPFVRIYEQGAYPQIKDVVNTNFCDIGIKVDRDKGLAIVVSCIDNLSKGAAGQALQNMNIICGLKETEGLL
ncbi:MAG: N-acetyl-gamma-glutamyl-phosphate reductase [Candidatus Omnitrophota bacterium]